MKNSIFEKKTSMILTALFCCLIWGSAFPSIKISFAELNLHNEFQFLFVAGLRFTLAGFGVLVFAKIKQKIKIIPSRKELPFMLLIALLQTFGAYLLHYIGMGNTTAVKASIITSLSVFLVAIFAHFMFKTDKLNWKKGIGLLCGFAGVILVNLSLLDNTTFSFTLTGEGFVALPCIFGALTVVLVRKYSGKIDVVKLNGWQLLIGGVMLIAVGYIGYPITPTFNLLSGALLFYLAAISAVAFTLWFMLLQHHNASEVEQYKFAVPLFGSVLSVIFVAGEHIGIEVLGAAVLVTIGTIIVNRQSRKKV